MSEAEHIAAQTATANHAFDLDQQIHERRDIEVLYRIYMEKRLASQASFYESRVRENQANADFTFVLSTVIMALSAFVATIGAFGNSPVLSLMSAILPAFAALLAAFRQLYGWERQISIYRDALLGLERVKLITPDKDRQALADLPGIYPKLVSSGEEIFTGEVNQWGQFVQSSGKEQGETTDERTMNTMMGSLQLTDAQIDTIRKIVAAGTPKAAFSQQTITVHPEETSVLPAGSGGGAVPVLDEPVPVVLTTTVSDPVSEAKVVEHTIPPEGLDDAIEDVVPSESFPSDTYAAPIETSYPVMEDAVPLQETFSPAETVPPAVDYVPEVETEFPTTDEVAAPNESEFPVTEDAVPEGELQAVQAVQPVDDNPWDDQPPPPEAFSALSPGALHVDLPEDPPEGTFTDEEKPADPFANG
ncbi:MAG: SLATT domain-containing protein [Chloroflexi bacterium]|nr:SLATT domain-containing protein [Chloroflexota bacterium]MCC6895234.1 SLATT domain-containing protein [Anaerolineae bacterium]